MAITLYEGSVGSGKSFCALKSGLNKINNGQFVIANFPITKKKRYLLKYFENLDEKIMSRWLFYDEITVELLVALSFEYGWYGKESSCLVIIDEAGVMFNSRDWQTGGSGRKDWIKFLSQSRKFGYDFIFIAQKDIMIDKQIRGLLEYSVNHFKLNNGLNSFWSAIFIKPIFYVLGLFSKNNFIIFMQSKRWYQTRLQGNISLIPFSVSVANRYDTMRTFDISDLINQIKKIYEGKIIPAPVLTMIDTLQIPDDKISDDK